jgi:hypothetical protein
MRIIELPEFMLRQVLLTVPALDRVHPGPLAATCKAFQKALAGAPPHDRFEERIARQVLALPAAGNVEVIARFRRAIQELEPAPWATRQWAFRQLIRRFGEVPPQEKKACLVAIIEGAFADVSATWAMEVMRRFARRLPASDVELHDWLTDKAIAIDPQTLNPVERTARALLLGAIAEKAGVHNRPCSLKRWQKIYQLLPPPGVVPSADCLTLVEGLREGLWKFKRELMDVDYKGAASDKCLDIGKRIPYHERDAERARSRLGERCARWRRRRQLRDVMQPAPKPFVLSPDYTDWSQGGGGGGGF